MKMEVLTASGTWRNPSWEHALVADAMRPQVITCPPDAPLTAVARAMATQHIHAIVIDAPPRDVARPGWGVVTDLAVAAAGSRAPDLTAAEVARYDLVAAEPSWPVERAALLMLEQGSSHLVVVDPQSGRPIAVVSTLDLAGVVAWGRA